MSLSIVTSPVAPSTTRPATRRPAPPADVGTAWRRSPLPMVLLAASIATWAASLSSIDVSKMTDLGLVSVLPVTMYFALGLLVVSFGAALRRGSSSWVLFLHVAALIVMIHGTPAIVYGTLRYSWAWKHVGLVDYIQRHGAVDTTMSSLSVYNDWPGFFALGALLTKAAGLRSAVEFAGWAPVFFNLAFVGGLYLLFRSFTRDRRLLWVAIWLFVLTNWIGQDYFSPQAMSYFFYLVLIGVCVGCFRRRATIAPADAPVDAQVDDQPARSGVAQGAIAAVAVVLIVTIVSSHQLTPFMVISALAGLWVLRQCRVGTLLFLAAAATALWLVFPAAAFLEGNLRSMLRSAGTLGSNASSNVLNLGHASSGQVFIATVDRGLTIAILVLAVVGFLAGPARGRRDAIPAILLVAPFPLVAASAYGGEMLFRVYFFALPAAAFLAATLVFPRRSTRQSLPRAAFVVVLSLGLLFGLLVSYYGKERVNYFTADEIAASKYLYAHARDGAVLVDLTSSYPRSFEHYERYMFVALSEQTATTKAALRTGPIDVLNALMMRGDQPGYLIVTRSQLADIEMTGTLPLRTGEDLVHALMGSRDFALVFQNRDAAVFKQTLYSGGPP